LPRQCPGQRGDARVALSLIGSLPAPHLCLADTAYDSDGLRRFLIERDTRPVIPNNPTRRPHPFDRSLYRARNGIERAICRLKDFRRVATRYNKLAQNYLATVHIAAITAFWL
jgi:putative transposase